MSRTEGPANETRPLLQDMRNESQTDEDPPLPLPWWRKQSPWWALAVVPLLTTSIGIVWAPKIEVYTTLACMTLKPELFEPNSIINTSVRLAAAPLPRICATDPDVRTIVAKLTAAETTMLGVLSCLTTGWWASLSDRTGRRTLFFVATFGMLCANIVYIFVNRFWRSLPGSYWCILLGPLIEGSFGGMPASLVAFNSYVGDTTPERRRSRTLSINFGLYWAGISFGPIVGSLAMRFTGNIISIFYIAVALQFFFILYTRFVLLEPLTKEQQLQARTNWILHHQDAKQALVTQGWWVYLLSPLLPIFRPLAALKPVIKKNSNPLRRPRRDWSLLLASVSFGTLYIIASDVPFKFQYASAAFGWTAEENGYFLSVLSATRGLYLTTILPLVIKLFRPPTHEIDIRVESDTEPSGYKIVKQKIESPTFDLRLARISIFIEASTYVVMLIYPSPYTLYFLGVVGTLGAGFPPAVQSVILSLYIQQGGTEIGKVFGALGVIQTLCAQIISPVLYGTVTVATVTLFPMAVFAISLAAMVTSVSILWPVRMPTQNELIANHSGTFDSSSTDAVRSRSSSSEPLVAI